MKSRLSHVQYATSECVVSGQSVPNELDLRPISTTLRAEQNMPLASVNQI